jgi:alkanesulfonate monooxygenase SsuD/methylene tetrahydromethanopterin reductase-like flavin-dependent oxidoreductase (luciferase family)
MDLGLHYWNFSIPGDPQRIADTLAAAAKTAEEAGFAELSVMDHYFQIESGPALRNRCSRCTPPWGMWLP